MQLPYFYEPQIDINNNQCLLSQATSKHCVQVLRMQSKSQLKITDGLGNLYTAQIELAHKANTIVSIENHSKTQPKTTIKHIAISLLKNTTRWEWFLEKAAEMGIDQVTPIICARTERQNFKMDRLQNIAISAMLQSQQTFLLQINMPIDFAKFATQSTFKNKLIAHCLPNEKSCIRQINTLEDTEILIGPEGDFTPQEIDLALANNYIPTSLGITRLRTETAGIFAASFLV
jgi:16S rRNA (uracil1498-N3)-methyltransferase